MLVPIVPFALVLGLTIASSPMPDLVGWLGSSLIFAGAAQLTVVTLTAEGAAVGAVVAAGLIVNARHFMYSAAMAPTFARQPRWFRWLGPYFLIDQQFALTTFRVATPSPVFRSYYLGAGVTFWVVWQASVALGMWLGPVIPAEWSLSFAVPLLFLGLVASSVRTPPAAVAAVAGAGVAWLASGVPSRGGIIVGAVAGVVAGVVAERRSG
jgi:predicted branched-subunit amino acid permease